MTTTRKDIGWHMKIMGTELMKYADLMMRITSILTPTHLNEIEMTNAELTPCQHQEE